MDPESTLSDIVKSEMAAFMGNLESKFGDAIAKGSPGNSVGQVQQTPQEGELAQRLVQQAEDTPCFLYPKSIFPQLFAIKCPFYEVLASVWSLFFPCLSRSSCL